MSVTSERRLSDGLAWLRCFTGLHHYRFIEDDGSLSCSYCGRPVR